MLVENLKVLNLLDNMTEEDSKIFEKQLIGDLNLDLDQFYLLVVLDQ